jgi:hypothetical protein
LALGAGGLASLREFAVDGCAGGYPRAADDDPVLRRRSHGTSLRRMWTGKPAAWLIRCPLTGHIGNHVGEMLATRNRMGLSPF